MVEDLRILAISADPPEARVDLATGVADPITLRALLVDPLGEVPSARVSWDLCAPGDDPGCPPGSAVASDADWGIGSSTQVQVPPELIRRSIQADPLRGFRGVRVRAVLRVEGAQRSSASALLFFSTSPGPLNSAPVLAGLRTARAGQPLADLPPGEPLRLSVGRANAMRPVLGPGSLEEYDSLDLTGSPVHLRERVTYSFYAHSSLAVGRGLVLRQGSMPVVVYQHGLDDFQADEPDPGSPEPPLGLFLAVPVTAGGSAGTLWIVARDTRGAVSWMATPYLATEERPECLGPLPRLSCPLLQFGCL